MNSKNHVIALGGSSFVREEIDSSLLLKLKDLIEGSIKEGNKFIIISGGGSTARKYQQALSKISDASDREIDLIGIKGTQINAMLLRGLFGKKANPIILDERFKVKNFSNYPIIIGGGQKPGNSTDFIAVQSALDFNVKRVIILGKPDHVYTSDMAKDKQAKPIKKMTWKEYFRIIPKKWKPGLHAPVGPMAGILAKTKNLEVIVASGADLNNLKKIIASKPFIGTTITN